MGGGGKWEGWTPSLLMRTDLFSLPRSQGQCYLIFISLLAFSPCPLICLHSYSCCTIYNVMLHLLHKFLILLSELYWLKFAVEDIQVSVDVFVQSIHEELQGEERRGTFLGKRLILVYWECCTSVCLAQVLGMNQIWLFKCPHTSAAAVNLVHYTAPQSVVGSRDSCRYSCMMTEQVPSL